MKKQEELFGLDDNPYEEGDFVVFTITKNIGKVLKVRDDFCEVEFLNTNKKSFIEHQYLKPTQVPDIVEYKEVNYGNIS